MRRSIPIRQLFAFIFFVLAVLALPLPAKAQSLDIYGGRTDISCTNSSGFMQTVKLLNRWWICTPAGHVFFFLGIGCMSHMGDPGCNGPALTSKFPSAAVAAYQSQLRYLTWGFNGVGEKTSNEYDIPNVGNCSPACQLLPEIQDLEILGRTLYQNIDAGACSYNSVKDVVAGTNGNGAPWYFKVLTDVFDGNMTTYFACYFATNAGFLAYKASAYFAGLQTDDSDFLLGVGPGPDFDAGGNSFGGGHNDSNFGRVVLTTSPVQTFNPNPARGNLGPNPNPTLYTDTKVYTKTAGSLPASCDITTPSPCTLHDFLYREYSATSDTDAAALGRLNTAWGTSGFYTSFGTTGTPRSQTICTGTIWTGTNSSCNDTLTNLKASPESVQVTVDGVLQAGDCPWSAGSSNSGGFSLNTCGSPGANQGFLEGQNSNTIGYSTATLTSCSGNNIASNFGNLCGEYLITSTTFTGATATSIDCSGCNNPWTQVVQSFVVPSNAAIIATVFNQNTNVSANSITARSNLNVAMGDSVFVQCKASVTVTFTVSDTAGNTFTAGPAHFQSGAGYLATFYVLSASANAADSVQCNSSANDSYLSMMAQQMSPGASSTDVAISGGTPSTSGQFTSASFNTSSAKEIIIASASAAAVAAGFGWNIGSIGAIPLIDYTTGAITINFKSPLSAGSHTIVVSYVQNGWMYGSGVMDEDGRHSWLGTNAVCLLPVNGGGPGTDSWACRPGNPGSWPAPNANTNLAADLNSWMAQFISKFLASINTTLKAAAPNMLFMGEDIIGGWGAPANKNVLMGAGAPGSLDILFTQNHWNPDGAGGRDFNCTTLACWTVNNTYLTRYFGDHPMMNFQDFDANPDSAVAAARATGLGDASPAFFTNSTMGQMWSNLKSAELNTLSYNGTYQWVGDVWWFSHDSGSEGTHFGLCDPKDNCYDGAETVKGAVSCSAPLAAYLCGSEGLLAALWQSSHAYKGGNTFTDANGYVEYVQSACTSAGSAPTWPIILFGPTADGTCNENNHGGLIPYGNLIANVKLANQEWLGVGGSSPSIAFQPQNQTINIGATATFTVVASGNPTLTYQWLLNGMNIPGATSASYTTPAEPIGANGSQFTVTVTNSAGSVTSNIAFLTVNPAQVPPAPTGLTFPRLLP